MRAGPDLSYQVGRRHRQHGAASMGEAVPADAAGPHQAGPAVTAAADDEQVPGLIGHHDQHRTRLTAHDDLAHAHVRGQAAEGLLERLG